MLRLQAGDTVGLVVDGGRLIVQPRPHCRSMSCSPNAILPLSRHRRTASGSTSGQPARNCCSAAR
jgi:hypothetical protein